MSRIIKEIILLTITAACVETAVWTGKNLFINSSVDFTHDYRIFILPLLTLVFGGAFFILNSILTKDAWLIYGSMIAIFGLPYSVAGFTQITVACAIVSAGIIGWALFQIRRTYSKSPSFQLTHLTKIGLPIYFTVISLLFTAFYYTGLSEENAFQALFPKPLIQTVFSALGDNLGSFIGMPSLHLNPNDTVDHAIEGILVEQAKSQGISVNDLSAAMRAQALTEGRRTISAQLGIPLQGNQKIGDVLNRVLQNRIANILGPYRSYLPIVVAITVFFTLKTISIPLYYLTLLIAFLLIKALLALTILKREIQQIPAERIVLS